MNDWRGAAGPGGAVGVASASDSGRMSSRMTAKTTSAACQSNQSSRARASGEKRNWPNDPAVVNEQKANGRQTAGSSLTSDPINRLKDKPDKPNPIRTPAERCSIAGVVE